MKAIVERFAKLAMPVVVGAVLLSCEELERTKVEGQGSGAYKADFRAWVKSEDTDTQNEYVLERWVLNIPREHIESYSGKNGEPATTHPDLRASKRNRFAVNLRIVLDTESGGVRTHPSQNLKSAVENEVIIRLSNAKWRTQPQSFGFCERPKEREVRRHDPCSDTDRIVKPTMCPVYMNKDGWSISLSVHRELIQEHNTVCVIVDEFLEKLENNGN